MLREIDCINMAESSLCSKFSGYLVRLSGLLERAHPRSRQQVRGRGIVVGGDRLDDALCDLIDAEGGAELGEKLPWLRPLECEYAATNGELRSVPGVICGAVRRI